jgi:predicted dehydrogenase
MTDAQSRREFLRRALLAGTAVPFASSGLAAGAFAAAPEEARQKKAPSQRIRIGAIGCAGRGKDNIDAVAHEEIVCLCDVDAKNLWDTKNDLVAKGRVSRDVASCKDFRELLDRQDLDAVVISTPDHMHAIPAVQAMRLGLDCYCEKPLAHSVHEVRTMRETAAEKKRVTQMGTQIHAGENYRRAVEIVRAGVLGAVRRVHVWMGGRPHTDGVRAKEGTPPSHVDYDLWIGPAPYRPFHPSHFHFKWRYWFDFGGGILADFGCHYMDLPHWALDLRHATTVEASGVKDYEGENDVPGKMKVEYDYPARGTLPPVRLTWYHGGWLPEGAEAYGKSSAVLFEGERGRLLVDYDTYKLFLDREAAQAAREVERIPPSPGHHQEWLDAIRARGTTTCNFDYSGALAETVLLGNVSYRAGGKKLEWDDKTLTATNVPEAAQYVRREYRKGWTL